MNSKFSKLAVKGATTSPSPVKGNVPAPWDPKAMWEKHRVLMTETNRDDGHAYIRLFFHLPSGHTTDLWSCMVTEDTMHFQVKKKAPPAFNTSVWLRGVGINDPQMILNYDKFYEDLDLSTKEVFKLPFPCHRQKREQGYLQGLNGGPCLFFVELKSVHCDYNYMADFRNHISTRMMNVDFNLPDRPQQVTGSAPARAQTHSPSAARAQAQTTDGDPSMSRPNRRPRVDNTEVMTFE
jgi:hypothetical protein